VIILTVEVGMHPDADCSNREKDYDDLIKGTRHGIRWCVCSKHRVEAKARRRTIDWDQAERLTSGNLGKSTSAAAETKHAAATLECIV
jgi:hypothetical protein